MFTQTITLARPLPQAPLRAKARPPEGLGRGSLLHTICGERPVERIMAGDLLLDAQGQIVELRAVRQMRARAGDLIRLLPDTESRGLLVGAGQKIAVSDWRSELLYGKAALTRAGALLDHGRITTTRHGATLYQLHFDRDCVLTVNGVNTLFRAPSV